MFYTYILTNKVLYVGVTGDLNRRIDEHIKKLNPNSFTSKYNLDKLIHIEEFTSIKDAIKREKQLKKWSRLWKEKLINKNNPNWLDFKTEIPDRSRG